MFMASFAPKDLWQTPRQLNTAILLQNVSSFNYYRPVISAFYVLPIEFDLIPPPPPDVLFALSIIERLDMDKRLALVH